MDTQIESMGTRIKDRRAELALSQRALSRLSGVSVDVIVKAEHEARPPRPSTVQRLAEALEVDVQYLTRGRVAERPVQNVFSGPRERQEVGTAAPMGFSGPNSSETPLEEALGRARSAPYEPVGIPAEEAEYLPPGEGVSEQFLRDKHDRDY